MSAEDSGVGIAAYEMHVCVTDDADATATLDFGVRADWLPRVGEQVTLDSGIPNLDLTVVEVRHWIQHRPGVSVTVTCEPANEACGIHLLELIDSGAVQDWLRQFPAVVQQ